jgi:hypothetical protein
MNDYKIEGMIGAMNLEQTIKATALMHEENKLRGQELAQLDARREELLSKLPRPVMVPHSKAHTYPKTQREPITVVGGPYKENPWSATRIQCFIVMYGHLYVRTGDTEFTFSHTVMPEGVKS